MVRIYPIPTFRPSFQPTDLSNLIFWGRDNVVTPNAIAGSIATFHITWGGGGYSPGDVCSLTYGDATMRVLTVGGSGEVLTAETVFPGTLYWANPAGNYQPMLIGGSGYARIAVDTVTQVAGEQTITNWLDGGPAGNNFVPINFYFPEIWYPNALSGFGGIRMGYHSSQSGIRKSFAPALVRPLAVFFIISWYGSTYHTRMFNGKHTYPVIEVNTSGGKWNLRDGISMPNDQISTTVPVNTTPGVFQLFAFNAKGPGVASWFIANNSAKFEKVICSDMPWGIDMLQIGGHEGGGGRNQCFVHELIVCGNPTTNEENNCLTYLRNKFSI